MSSGISGRVRVFRRGCHVVCCLAAAMICSVITPHGPLADDGDSLPRDLSQQVLLDRYLQDHPTPEDCEYYLCGPPMMTAAVITMLENLGVEQDNILLDNFGG